MKAHASAKPFGVKVREPSERFPPEGLGGKIENDDGISVFFVPHGGTQVGFCGYFGPTELAGSRLAGR